MRSVILVALTTLLVVLPHHQPTTGKAQKRYPELEKRLAQLPIVDFTETTETDRVRRARNDRHNSRVPNESVKKFQLNDSMPPVLLGLPLTDQPAFPAVPMTDVVAVGTVQNVQAYLSSDKTSVYSEVTFEIEEVLKGNERATAGSFVSAERFGGAVRFPSGKILRRGATGRNIPVNGGRYLLFLNSIQGDNSFTIVTGYELNDTVSPLDGIGETDPDFKPYEKYRNASVPALLDEVKREINERLRALLQPGV